MESLLVLMIYSETTGSCQATMLFHQLLQVFLEAFHTHGWVGKVRIDLSL